MENTFKINFQLIDPDKVMLWGDTIHWFGLTDGLLWITAGDKSIYEYSDEVMEYYENKTNKYNDYQISRFLEDFSELFEHISESVPEKYYADPFSFDETANKCLELHYDDEDDLFDTFYDNEYRAFIGWLWDRTMDSGHLVCGPHISCVRCGEKIKLIWFAEEKNSDGVNMWSTPKGCFEMPYKTFVSEVKNFFADFFTEMDKQVENAVKKDWGKVKLDKKRLVEEHKERKEMFYQRIAFLDNCDKHTDWKKIDELHKKLLSELEG